MRGGRKDTNGHTHIFTLEAVKAKKSNVQLTIFLENSHAKPVE